jgi:hypothetical protein
MIMVIIVPGWILFCILLSGVLLTALLMQWFGGFFITRDVLVRNFTILDLELASTEKEIDNTLKGIVQLEPAVAGKVIRSLTYHLYVDFLFMPAAYGTIFVACLNVAWKMPASGAIFFTVMGWLQVASWVSDILENIYLLGKINRIKSEYTPSFMSFHTYQYLEVVKWGLALLAIVCLLSALMYFWISGLYMEISLQYLLAVMIELTIFVLLMKWIKNTGKRWKATLTFK